MKSSCPKGGFRTWSSIGGVRIFNGIAHLEGKKDLRSCFFADSAGRGYLLRKSAETREATARSCSPCLRFSECLAYVLVSAKVYKHILFTWMH